MRTERKYHHGDLRASLLREARALLAADGVDGLSLRKLGERVGASRMAPYHYFPDKHALLCALAAEGFRELDALLGEDDVTLAPRQRLSGFVRHYLEFARQDPERYDLMFGRRLWKLAQPTPELREIAYATFRRYVRRVGALLPASAAGSAGQRQALRLAQASWATLHGLSHLIIDGIYVDIADMEDVSEIAVRSLLRTLDAPSG